MPDNIRTFIQDLPIVDVHEHHMPEVLLSPDVGLLRLFDESYAGWTRERPFFLPSETPAPPSDRTGCDVWKEVSRYLEHSGSSTFVRNLCWAIESLYDLGEGGINASSWERLDAEIRRRHRDPAWVGEVLARANLRYVITDPYSNPMLNARQTLGERYSSVMRINALAVALGAVVAVVVARVVSGTPAASHPSAAAHSPPPSSGSNH